MIVYKGTTADMKSRCGGNTDNSFKPGQKFTVENEDKLIKTVSYGYHAYEYPLKCLNYYRLDGRNRFWRCEATGNIDEDKDGKVASEHIEWLKELSLYELAVAAVDYMIAHPDRSDWQVRFDNVIAAEDEVEIDESFGIAIARGEHPKAKAPEGAVIALITECDGVIKDAKVITVPDKLADRWIQLRRPHEKEIS
jgi:Holliday junction resolvase-like predicted endonuclease